MKKYRTYILIAVPIILFNLIAVFGADILLADDAAHYFRLTEGTLFKIKFIHLFLGTIINETTYTIMGLSPELIRGIYVLFVMVPLSCLIYYLFQKKMGFPGVAAYSAAVLPNILPAQFQIPAFVNGTQVLLGLIAVAACLLFSFKYLDHQAQKNWKPLLMAAFLYLLATLVTDQPVFSFPVLVFAIWGYHKLNRKHLFLAVSFSLVFLHKAAWIVLLPRGSTHMAETSISGALKRLGQYFSAMLPLPQISPEGEFIILLAIVFCSIIVTGLFFYMKNHNEGFTILKPFAHLSHKKFIFYIYGFLFIWLVSNIIVFITVSPRPFRVRYSYYAAYGLNALLALSLYPILAKIFRSKKKLVTIAFAVLILITGWFRITQLKSHYDRLNADQAMIIENLNRFQFPENSQIVIYSTYGGNFWGDWYQSSGHLRYMLKRNDINGFIGNKGRKYFDFYDPFDVRSRGFGKAHWMRGLDINRPLFLFVEKNKEFKQYEYALQWKEKTGKAEWTIFHFDKKTGKESLLLRGIGSDDYYSTLARLRSKGISQNDILWGGTISKIF
ncbi:hypothetical protein ACFLRT_02690 [Acidobacteriota bacterium]